MPKTDFFNRYCRVLYIVNAEMIAEFETCYNSTAVMLHIHCTAIAMQLQVFIC